MASDDEVLIKIAVDIAQAVEALGTLTEQMGEVVKSISDVGEKSEEGEAQTKSFWETWVSGAENGTTASVAWGEQMSKAFDSLKEGVGSAIKSLPNLVMNAAAVGDELFTLSNRLNISVDSIGQLKYISEQTGAPLMGMAKTIQNLGVQMLDSTSKQSQGIEKLGLSVKELKALKPEEAYFKIIEAAQQLPEGMNKAAAATEALGKGFGRQAQLINEDIGKLRKAYKELGTGAEDLKKLAVEGDRYSDALNDIRLVQDQWKNSIANALLPTINDLLEAMPGLGGAVLTLGEGFMDTASSILPLLGNIALMKSSGLAGTMTEWAGKIPGVSAAMGGMKTALTGLTGALGPLALALGAAAAIFATWKAANAESGWIRSLSDGVEKLALRWNGMTSAEADATIAQQHQTQRAVEAAEAAKGQAQATDTATTAIRAQVDGLTALTGKQAEAKKELAGLSAVQKSQISTLIEQGVAMKDISEASGVSAAALELFKKQIEATKKSLEDSPFTKLHKETKDLADGIKLATAAGQPLAEQLEQFGAKSAEAMAKAAGLRGELAKVPPEVRAMADAFTRAQLAEKLDPLIAKAIELSKAFSEKMTVAAKASADAVTSMSNEMTLNMLSGSAKRIKQIQIERDKAIEAVKQQKDAQVKALAATEDAIKKNAESERKAVASIKGLSKELADEKVREINRAEEAALAAARSELDAVTRQYDDQLDVVGDYYDQKVAIENKDTKNFEKDMELRGIKTKKVAQDALTIEREKLATLKALNDPFYDEQIRAQEKVVDGAEVAAGKIKVDWGGALDSIVDSFEQLANISGSTFGGMLKSVAEVAGGLSVMKSSFGSAIDMFKGAKGLGGITGSFKNLSGGVGGLIGGITKGLGTVMPMAGAIIAGVGAAVKVGKKLWDGLTTSGGEKVAKEVGKKFGVKITEEMGDAINKSAKDLFKGDKFTAEIFHIGDIIKAAGGVTEKNFDKLLGNLGQVFDLVKRGKMTADQARQVLDQNFGAFAQHVLESGKVASKTFQDILKANKESGVQSAEVTAFVANQTGRLGGALAKLAGNQQQTNESMGRFERLAVAGFNAALAAGVPFIDALGQMGPALDKIIEGNKKLGREGGAAIQELLKFREVATANADLVESAGALNEVMLALSNTGALNTETMADLQAQGGDTFAQLTAAGFTEQQALQQMKGFLEQVRNAHEELGLPIDENTQRMIDQATQNGVLKEQQMSTNEVMMTGLGAIIEALGGKMPEAFKKMADSGVAAAGQIKGSTDGATAAVAEQAKQVAAVPWTTYAGRGVAAGSVTGTAMGGVTGSIGKVQGELNSTDWSGWSDEAVSAANEAQAAIDAVSLGSSPGGIKEIPLKLKEAMNAFSQWEQAGVSSAKSVREAVDAMSATHEPTGGIGGSAIANAAQTTLADSAGREAAMAGGSTDVKVDIQALDSAGVEAITEAKVIPAIVKALRKGGRGVTDIAGVLR